MKRALLFLRRTSPGIVAVVLIAWLVFSFPAFFLEANRPAQRADVIVVLGGETPNRSARAAELFKAGVAQQVIVTGAGDAALIQRQLVRAGVPASAILLEEESMSTWENAIFTDRLLRATHAREAVLVTSWYHTRRSLATFRKVSPGVKFTAASALQSWDTHSRPKVEEAKCVAREYVKLLGYLL